MPDLVIYHLIVGAGTLIFAGLLVLAFSGLWRWPARWLGFKVHVWGPNPNAWPGNPYTRVCRHCGVQEDWFEWDWEDAAPTPIGWERMATKPHTPNACWENVKEEKHA